MLDAGILVDNLDEIDDILILRFGYIIVNLEKLLNILEFSLIFNESLKQPFVLLVAYLNEILRL
jgi:hypothetical protein